MLLYIPTVLQFVRILALRAASRVQRLTPALLAVGLVGYVLLFPLRSVAAEPVAQSLAQPVTDWTAQSVGPDAPPLPPHPVWLRAWLRVPDSIAGDSGPDLWRDSMTLTLGSLPGPVEVFLNGRSILTVTNLPDGQLRRFKVPKGIFEKGVHNAWVIRLDGRLAPRGLVAPPVFAGYFDEVRFERPWQLTTHAPSAEELRPVVANLPAFASYGDADFRPATTVMSASPQPEKGRFVPPAAALALLKPAEDLVVEELLHEPEVAQPTQLSFDARGRLWIAQYRQYPFPSGVQMISRDKYYRSKRTVRCSPDSTWPMPFCMVTADCG